MCVFIQRQIFNATTASYAINRSKTFGIIMNIANTMFNRNGNSVEG